jgi:hypothetical protein
MSRLRHSTSCVIHRFDPAQPGTTARTLHSCSVLPNGAVLVEIAVRGYAVQVGVFSLNILFRESDWPVFGRY